MNIITDKAINQLISESSKIHHYIIPSYQRGYRWGKDEVEALLDDVYNFLDDPKNHASSYWLQPIVVRAIEGKWEVVDGQQRLTTIFLILKFLGLKHYHISFEKREQSEEFLNSIASLIFEGKTFNNPDFHYISQAYALISDWFTQKEEKEDNNSIKLEFSLGIMKRVKVIWYEIGNKNEIEKNARTEARTVFGNLNSGKIPLTDSELIKALFIQSIEKKYGLSTDSLMRQSELGNEWDKMEHQLQQSKLWLFLTNNNSLQRNYACRLELIFELIGKANKTSYPIFHHFLEKLNNGADIDTVWQDVKMRYDLLYSWYDDRELYHWVGFLLATGKSNLNTILTKYSNSEDKKSFKTELRKLIKNSTLDNISIDELEYGKDDAEIRNILLLFNIIATQYSTDKSSKFPLHKYKGEGDTEKWSLEHLHPQNPKKLNGEKAKIEWLSDTLESLNSILGMITVKNEDNRQQITALRDRVDSMLTKREYNDKDIELLASDVILFFQENGTHSISNLALLQSNKNSALSNGLFLTKRNKIIRFERDGEFIPICTRNAF